MTVRSTRGFSLVEVLISIVVMSTGVLLLAGGSIFITRNLARARLNTVAGAMAQAKADELRAVAAVGAPACLSPLLAGSTSPTTSAGVTVWWTVSASASMRTVRVMTSYRVTPTRTRTDTLTARIPC
jgi:prepilin-type N-terminal cleavage/methylation domain-containing protein